MTVHNGFKLNNAVFQNSYSNNLPYGTPFTATPGASPTPANNTPLPLVPLKTSSKVGLTLSWSLTIRSMPMDSSSASTPRINWWRPGPRRTSTGMREK